MSEPNYPRCRTCDHFNEWTSHKDGFKYAEGEPMGKGDCARPVNNGTSVDEDFGCIWHTDLPRSNDNLHEFSNGVRVKPETLKELHVSNFSQRRVAEILGVSWTEYEDAMVEHFFDRDFYDTEAAFRKQIR
jgi:hypothetical protein